MSEIICGDALTELRKRPAESVHCCVTSPPYWGLRSYGTEPRVWGGSIDCEHVWIANRYYVEGGGGAGSSGEAFSQAGPENAERIKKARWREDDTCSNCGAWRGHLGLEPTPDMYVTHMVWIFREVRRVLRDDGTLWLVLGDSYATGAGAVGHCPGGGAQGGPVEETILRKELGIPVSGIAREDAAKQNADPRVEAEGFSGHSLARGVRASR